MPDNPFQRYIDAVLLEAVRRGMKTPFVLDTAFANGTTMVVRYDGIGSALTPTLISESFVVGGDDFPISGTLTDANGLTTRFTIDRSGPTFH